MRIILFVLLFLSSCTKVYSVYSECENTDDALKSWQTIETFNYYYINSKNMANININKWENRFSPFGAYYGNGVIEANDNYRTILHELGHFFGYSHNGNSNSVMYRYHNENATNFIF